MTVNVLFPDGVSYEKWCDTPLARPFEERTIQCLGALSRRLVTNHEARRYPELIALGYWLRSANLIKIGQDYTRADRVYRPLGTVFHVAPANVETLFVYSGVVSLLMGNRNLIRISSRRGRTLEILLNTLLEIQKENSWAPVLDRLLLVDFPRDSRVLSDISKKADLRVLWGSNGTVNNLRQIPIHAHAREICFPDKFSLCLLGAGKVVAESDLTSLLQGFSNDVYLFAQQACSSPRCLIWLGNNEQVQAAKGRFWPELENYLEQKNKAALSAGEKYNSLAAQQFLAAQGQGTIVCSNSPLVKRLEIDTLSELAESRHLGCGLFFELTIEHLDELLSQLRTNHQTLSCWGIDTTSLCEWLAGNGSEGIDRVCDVGRALDFEMVWDGVDLVAAFSRQMLMDSR